MKGGRNGKTPLLVSEEPALLSDHETNSNNDHHRQEGHHHHHDRKENVLALNQRKPSWKQRLGFSNKEKNALYHNGNNNNNGGSTNAAHQSDRRQQQQQQMYFSSEKPKLLQQQQQSSASSLSIPPERQNKHERQRSNDSFHQRLEMEYSVDDDDDDKTDMIDDEDLFAVVQQVEDTPKRSTTSKSSSKVSFLHHGEANAATAAAAPEEDDHDMPNEEFARLASQTTPNSRNGNSKSKSANSPSHKVMATQRTKAMLSRPFGRSSLPQSMVKKWNVEVSPAEWDGEEHLWKYRILVQRRMQVRDVPTTNGNASPQHSNNDNNSNNNNSPAPPQKTSDEPSRGGLSPSASSSSANQSTTAYTWRSLSDFIWLETALRAEYHGALVLPLLSIALGTSDLADYTQHEVDANLLRDWLSDVLNGIRGQGELLLPCPTKSSGVNLMTSEAMEAFLYRNTDPLALVTTSAMKTMAHHASNFPPSSASSVVTTRSTLDRPWSSNNIVPASPGTRASSNHHTDETANDEMGLEDSFVNSLFSKPFAACGTLEIMVCGSDLSTVSENNKHLQRRRSTAMLRQHLPLDVMACSSQALGDAQSLNVQDSFVEHSNTNDNDEHPDTANTYSASQLANKNPTPSLLLVAQEELIRGWYHTAMGVMEKMRILVEEESQLGAAWKRFAISLSNLFAYEKDVEHARIGDVKLQRENLPYRKIHKSTVDDCLRVLAKHKMDRSVFSLRLLTSMLTAYLGDLSAAGPAIQTFGDAMEQVQYLRQQQQQHQDKRSNNSNNNSTSPTSWQDQIKNVLGLFHSDTSNNNNHQDDHYRGHSPARSSNSTVLSTSLSWEKLEQYKKVFELRVQTHELLLRDNLTTLCRTTLLRTARMAWKFYHIEAIQATLVQSAAATLRTKLRSVVNKEILSKMMKRHAEEEKEDIATEMNVIHRIVSILGSKQTKHSMQQQQQRRDIMDMKENIEVDHEVKPMEEVLGEQALQLARERVGRWDAKVALAIMKAVGIEDPNVHLEETTRDLRVVRKYAIGLRDHLSRCMESLQVLQDTLRKPISTTTTAADGTSRPPTTIITLTTNKKHETAMNNETRHIREIRREFLSELAQLFSGKAAVDQSNKPKLSSSSVNALASAGISINDPAGWSPAIAGGGGGSTSKWSLGRQGKCGDAACAYVETKDAETEAVLGNVSKLLEEYNRRVESIESFVYMECVGIQLEKHFKTKRTRTLTAFEKKTDITTAITIATRKQLPLLVNELKGKLKKVGADISQTTVREAKELHLESKTLKTELHDLSMRRLMRARETCTERSIDIMSLWADYEEGATTLELKALDDAKAAVEKGLRKEDIVAFLSHANST